MKKIVLLGLTVLCLFCLAGCKKNPGQSGNPTEQVGGKEDSEKNPDVSGNKTPEQSGSQGAKLPVVNKFFRLGDTLESTDCNPGNSRIRMTDMGYYYNSIEHQGIRYTDKSTGMDLFLCNKPECRHDGNEFCVATNKKLKIRNFCLYGGYLFAVVAEETDTQFAYKLCSIALDGSEMNEIVTFYEFVKGEQRVAYSQDAELLIHRNKVIFPFFVSGAGGFGDTQYHGFAIYDFDTGKVTYLDEEPASKDNPERTNVKAHGDYIYYCVKEEPKTVLYRYHLTTGNVEEHKLLTNFVGRYVVVDDNTVVYTRVTGRSLCVYHRETGENEEKVQFNGLNGIGSLITDGTYIYTHEEPVKMKKGNKTEEVNLLFHVYTLDLEHVTTVDLTEKVLNVPFEGVPVPLRADPENYSYVGEDVYCTFMEYLNSANKIIVKCKREDLLKGQPEFEFIYKDETIPYGVIGG